MGIHWHKLQCATEAHFLPAELCLMGDKANTQQASELWCAEPEKK